jgi:cytochrome b subunit of formate dehydrogenase
MTRIARCLVVPLLLTTLIPMALAQECQDCHESEPEVFAETVHGFLDCTDCHTPMAEFPHPEEAGPVDCSSCHDEVVQEYAASVHGLSRFNGSREAPDCVACHGDLHRMVPASDPASPVSAEALPATCGTCHADPEVVKKFGIPWAQPIQAYEASVHATAVHAGGNAASCSDCHGSHAIYGGHDSRSTVFHQRVPETCGKCHEGITQVYQDSVHGIAAAHGVYESPVCTDCHGEHRILSPIERGSPVYASNIPRMTCGRCHGDLRLIERFGLSDKVPAYEDSYHGLATRSGAITTAQCSSCHGVHDILPSSDPASHVHADNLAETCGKCHPGAGARFAIGAVHVLPSDQEHAAVYYIRQLYIALIIFSVGGMLLHNFADLYRKVRNPPPRPALPPRGKVRMSAGFRLAHGLLLSSFMVLVYTGFALTYPEAAWATPLLHWEDSLGLRGGIHRAAAVVMVLAFVVHFIHLLINARARACIWEMLPCREDWVEFRERMRYYAGRRKDPPHAPRLGYPEKVEYLALLWGSLIMVITGVLLWFESLILRWLPTWVADVATVVHFYEAILASLAILVWHFYFVIFDPVVYPMDTTWLTGRSAPGRALERREV